MTALDPKTAPPLSWGILAPGGIANKFAEAVRAHTDGTVAAVGSRNLERAQQFAERHGIARSYGSYEQLVADPDVQAVYIASPHSHHRDQALLAIDAGKHVLIEKALAFDSAQVEQIFDAAGRAKVFAMEAMWTRHLPHVLEMHRLIDTGALGELVSIVADHGQYFDFDPESRVFNPELAGGAMLDLGVYPLAFILDFLGAPETVTAAGSLNRTGVEGQVAMLLGYPGTAGTDIVAQGVAHTTLWAQTANTAVLSGTKARIEVDGWFYTPSRFRLIPFDGEPSEFDGRVENGFQFQIAEAARCIAEGRHESERMSWQHSRDLMSVMDQARRQIGAL